MHEVLNRRRSLTLKMILRLHEGLGIPEVAHQNQRGAGGLREARGRSAKKLRSPTRAIYGQGCIAGPSKGAGAKIRTVLEAIGVEFIDENGGGPGVRLRHRQQKKR